MIVICLGAHVACLVCVCVCVLSMRCSWAGAILSVLLAHTWALAVGAGILLLQTTALWSHQAHALVVVWLVASALSLCLVRHLTCRVCS
jgi:hypothetical protein